MFNNAFVFNPNDSAYSFMAIEMKEYAQMCIHEAFIQEAMMLHPHCEGLILPSNLDDIFHAARSQQHVQD